MDVIDIRNLAGQSSASPLRNFTTICVAIGRVNSNGVFRRSNPFTFSAPLLLMQLAIASAAILVVSIPLKPLGQPLVVRQLLAAIILGPSVLGRNPSFSNLFFPGRGYIVLDTFASFGLIFYFFLIGVQIDPWILKRIQKKAYPLGFSSVALPMVLSIASCFLVLHNVELNQSMTLSLPVVAQAESVLAFPVIAQTLAELKITNSEFGRVALSSALVAGLSSLTVITVTVLWHQETAENLRAVQTIINSIIFGLVIIFVIRPTLLWMMKGTAVGEPLKESHVIVILVAALVTGFCSQALGLNIYIGPLLLGVTIPAGPPIGSSLVDKLDLMTNWVFMPLYFLKTGLIANIFAVRLKNYLIVQFISLVSAFGKFMGMFLIALCVRIPLRDAVSLGLIMNSQGVLELAMFRMLTRNKVIDNEAFVIMCVNLLLITGIITPIIKYLYDPSRRYMVYTRRTVMHSKPNSELRVLVCIHDKENVPTAINFLEALNPVKRSRISVFVLHLVELVGRAHPLLIPQTLTRRPSRKGKTSDHVVDAFTRLARSKEGLLTVHPFTSISPYKSMHDDVCSIALERRISLVIIPSYKRLGGSGSGSNFCKKSIKITNDNILDKAPCSVAILFDRGLLNDTRPNLDSWSSYRVAVLFFGGPDDREALAIAARMAGHNKINLNIIRLLENGSISSDDTSERRLDNEMMSELRTAMVANRQVIYVEEVVMDGTGTISVIRSMESQYELVIVGRFHDNESPLLSGLTDWHDDKELGTIGELLASAPFLSNTNILVVQQHISGTRNRKKSTRDKSLKDAEAEDMPIHRRIM